MNIAYLLRDNGACGYYRLDLPLQTIRRREAGKHAVIKIEKGDNAAHMEAALTHADVVVIPRPSETEMLHIITEMSKTHKVVVDYDDDLWNISPLSPHYEDFGTENVQYVFPDGKKVELWKDGKNINLKENIQRLDNTKRTIERAHLLTVTTDLLASAYREYTDRIAVLPNCIDTALWQKLPIKNERTKIYWSGGSSHYEDICLLPEALRAVLDKYPDTEFVTMGQNFRMQALDAGLPEGRFIKHGWVHTQGYPYKTAIINPDIAVIPLVDNVFNSRKSAIKWIEMSALEVPCITSYVSPYKEVSTNSNGIYIEGNDKNAWIEGLSMLIEDSILRAKIAGEAKRTVTENFDINKQYQLWLDAYGGIV